MQAGLKSSDCSVVDPTFKILLLGRYESLAASTRYRLLQYVPALEGAGFSVQFEPLLDNAYLNRLFSGQRAPNLELIRAYSRRVGQMLRSDEFDAVWIYVEALPWLPHFLETLLLRSRAPVVVDYDDAVFHRYDQHHSWAVRQLLGRKIDHVMRNAALVVAGNSYIAERAIQAGAPRVEILPTVIDIDHYPLAPALSSGEFVVGWIGSPSSASNLQVAREPLERFQEQSGCKVVLVGAGELDLGTVAIDSRRWSQETELQNLREFDVGIMPLVDEPFERGKCGFKLIQYMAASRPVIGSPIGVNSDIIIDGYNGFSAYTSSDWANALERLRRDPLLRQEMGARGRKLVEERYSLQVAGPRMVELMRSLVEDAAN